jgi:hypothetical protein
MPADTKTRLTADWLNGLAALGDTTADKVIDEIVADVVKPADASRETRQQEFAGLTRMVWADVDQMHPKIDRFVRDGDPIADRIDLDKVAHAQAFFEEHGVAVITALFHAALPEAYLGERGVQALDLTGELVSNWSRRIQDTGQFLLNVLTPAPWLAKGIVSLSPGQAGARAARRVRLNHAAVRWLLNARHAPMYATQMTPGVTPDTVWADRMVQIGEKVDAQGKAESQPVNQQDLLATLGTFTSVTFDSLAKLGVTFDEDDRVAYHHLWDVVGWHLGIGDKKTVTKAPAKPADDPFPDNNILPLDVEEMDALYLWLSAELQGETSQGCRLAKTLVQELSLPLPRPLDGGPAVVARYLIGDVKADALQIERGGFTELLTVRTGRLERLIRQSPRVPGNPMLMSMAGATLTRYALREFVARSRGSERGLRLDPTIAARWGIQVGPEVAPAGRI